MALYSPAIAIKFAKSSLIRKHMERDNIPCIGILPHLKENDITLPRFLFIFYFYF